MSSKLELKRGDIIQWSYLHFLNSKTSIYRTKTGVFIGLINHTSRYIMRGGFQLAKVKFRGNKRVSRVPYFELDLYIPVEELRSKLNSEND